VIVLCGSFFQNIFESFNVNLTTCDWMIIITAALTPLCLLGTPKEFWGVAVGALASTIIACVMIMIKEGMDTQNENTCYQGFTPNHPEPKSPLDFGQAFSSIMFAFAGASTFPTIQADMKDRSKFTTAAIYAMLILCAIYLPMSVVGWWFLGDKVGSSVVDSLCDGPAKIMVQILFLCHLVSALPIVLSPPFQFFEEILNIPSSFSVKRVIFRSSVMTILLIIALSLPNFGAILNLIGATTITLLNFVFPPLFYLLLARKSSQEDQLIIENPENIDSTSDSNFERFDSVNLSSETGEQRMSSALTMPVRVSLSDKIYCVHLILVCSVGGIIAFVSAIKDIGSAAGESCWTQL